MLEYIHIYPHNPQIVLYTNVFATFPPNYHIPMTDILYYFPPPLKKKKPYYIILFVVLMPCKIKLSFYYYLKYKCHLFSDISNIINL